MVLGDGSNLRSPKAYSVRKVPGMVGCGGTSIGYVDIRQPESDKNQPPMHSSAFI